MIPGDPTGCMLSNDPAASDTSRPVGVNTHSVTAFNMAGRKTVAAITIEPVPGIGDEAFYQVDRSGKGEARSAREQVAH